MVVCGNSSCVNQINFFFQNQEGERWIMPNVKKKKSLSSQSHPWIFTCILLQPDCSLLPKAMLLGQAAGYWLTNRASGTPGRGLCERHWQRDPDKYAHLLLSAFLYISSTLWFSGRKRRLLISTGSQNCPMIIDINHYGLTKK